jgi:hypothetical protein
MSLTFKNCEFKNMMLPIFIKSPTDLIIESCSFIDTQISSIVISNHRNISKTIIRNTFFNQTYINLYEKNSIELFNTNLEVENIYFTNYENKMIKKIELYNKQVNNNEKFFIDFYGKLDNTNGCPILSYTNNIIIYLLIVLLGIFYFFMIQLFSQYLLSNITEFLCAIIINYYFFIRTLSYVIMQHYYSIFFSIECQATHIYENLVRYIYLLISTITVLWLTGLFISIVREKIKKTKLFYLQHDFNLLINLYLFNFQKDKKNLKDQIYYFINSFLLPSAYARSLFNFILLFISLICFYLSIRTDCTRKNNVDIFVLKYHISKICFKASHLTEILSFIILLTIFYVILFIFFFILLLKYKFNNKVNN